MRVLEVRPEQCLIQEDDGEIISRPTGEYYKLRYFTYNNRRIHHIFDKDMYVFETYDQRIFNASMNGMRIQLRQDLSNQIVDAILQHESTGSSVSFEVIFDRAVKEVPFHHILDMYLKNIACLEITKFGYEIHRDFLIDFKGNAWIRAEEENKVCFKKEELRRYWNSLCIVMQGHSSMVQDSFIPDSAGKLVKVNALTMTIITKVMFLVDPNMQDEVFTNQLPAKLHIRLKRLSGGKK